MRVLGIETTCDETAAAVVERRGDGTAAIHSNEVMSQIRQHAAYGGVVPEIAARAHVDVLDRLILRAVEKAGMTIKQVDGIAAAAGPGLIGGVIVGLTAGKALALALRKPFRRGQSSRGARADATADRQRALSLSAAARLGRPHPARRRQGRGRLSAAGRHAGRRRRRGLRQDRQDARPALPPAARWSSAMPRTAIPNVSPSPRPMLGRPRPDFSLSGLKTAVRLAADDIKPLTATDVNDLCASFQAAVVDTIIDRIRVATRLFREKVGPCEAIVAAGGCRLQRCDPSRDGAVLRRGPGCASSSRHRTSAPTTAR